MCVDVCDMWNLPIYSEWDECTQSSSFCFFATQTLSWEWKRRNRERKCENEWNENKTQIYFIDENVERVVLKRTDLFCVFRSYFGRLFGNLKLDHSLFMLFCVFVRSMVQCLCSNCNGMVIHHGRYGPRVYAYGVIHKHSIQYMYVVCALALHPLWYLYIGLPLGVLGSWHQNSLCSFQFSSTSLSSSLSLYSLNTLVAQSNDI